MSEEVTIETEPSYHGRRSKLRNQGRDNKKRKKQRKEEARILRGGAEIIGFGLDKAKLK